jgi:hypothetical protein
MGLEAPEFQARKQSTMHGLGAMLAEPAPNLSFRVKLAVGR